MKIMFSYKNMTQDVKEIKMNWNNAKAVILKNEDVQNELRLNETEYKIIEEIIMEKKLTQKIWRN